MHFTCCSNTKYICLTQNQSRVTSHALGVTLDAACCRKMIETIKALCLQKSRRTTDCVCDGCGGTASSMKSIHFRLSLVLTCWVIAVRSPRARQTPADKTQVSPGFYGHPIHNHQVFFKQRTVVLIIQILYSAFHLFTVKLGYSDLVSATSRQ